MNSWDKIRIKGKDTMIEIDDIDVTFAMVESNYDSDGDMSTEPYSIKDLISSAEEQRHKRDLAFHDNWEKYQTELKKAEKIIDAIRKENEKLTEKLKELMLK